MYTEPGTYDILGVGFGPSNLALAIALEEILRARGRELSHCFIERQPHFSWHGDMLLPGTDMQISFLKDLVSLRDPTSPYSFVNYLRQHQRLEAFINQKTFFPSRIEFNDYLRWTACHFEAHCRYGEIVTRVEPEYQGRDVVALHVHSTDSAGRERQHRTRSLVFAPGGRPSVPAWLANLKDERVIHSSRYLSEMQRNPVHSGSDVALAVIGGGQSAAEIFLDLEARYPQARVDLILRGSTLKPSEDGPSINHIFDPDYTDFFFGQPQPVRQSLLAEFRNTNYAVVDGDLIERISAMLYAQRVDGNARVRVLSSCSIGAASADQDGIGLELCQAGAATPHQQRYQRVIAATGYQRDTSRALLAGLEHELDGFSIGRHYQLATPAHVQPPIFVQGASETTHGLADTLLSVLAIRSHEIALSLTDQLLLRPAHGAVAEAAVMEEVG